MTLTSARVRTIAVTSVVAALIAMTPAAAHAAKPIRIPGDPTPTPISFGTRPGDISDACGFPVDGQVISRETVIIFSSGAVLVAGTYKVSLTNAINGKSIDINASGPGRIDPNGNFSGTGPQVFFLGPDEALGGGIWLFHGKTSFTRDANGLISSITSVGTRSGNLCAQLT